MKNRRIQLLVFSDVTLASRFFEIFFQYFSTTYFVKKIHVWIVPIVCYHVIGLIFWLGSITIFISIPKYREKISNIENHFYAINFNLPLRTRSHAVIHRYSFWVNSFSMVDWLATNKYFLRELIDVCSIIDNNKKKIDFMRRIFSLHFKYEYGPRIELGTRGLEALTYWTFHQTYKVCDTLLFY